jgi:hypothetical protein
MIISLGGPHHSFDHFAHRLKVFLCRPAKLVHVEVRPRERELAYPFG